MQQAFAYNLAKNVNNSTRPVAARRAASAYHLARHPSPHSSSSSLSSLNEECIVSPDSNGMYGMSLLSSFGPGVSPASTKPPSLPCSSSASSLTDMCAGGDPLAVPVAGPLCIQAQDTDHDRHVSQRGSAVDNMNPFIGYFHTSTSSSEPIDVSSTSSSLVSTAPIVPPRPISATSLKDSLRGTYQTSTTALLNQPKRLAQWLGSSTKLLPSLFTRHPEDREDAVVHKGTGTEQCSGRPPRIPITSALTPAVVLEPQVEVKLADQSNRALSTAARRERPLSASASSSSLCLPSSSRFQQEFEVLATLGHGGQGMVYKVQSRVDKGVYAVKKVMFSPTEQRSSVVQDQALREVQAMASLSSHPNVVRYHTAWFEKEVVDSATAAVVPHLSGSPSSVSFSGTKDHSLSGFDEDEGLSMGGFEFAESSSRVVETELEVTLSQAVPLVLEEEGASETIDVLYIQMELCGTTSESTQIEVEQQEDGERDSFQRLLHRLTSEETAEHKATIPPTATVHSTLASWLRATLEKRTGPPEDDDYTTHHQGLELFLDVVYGVHHLHESGVIHRDLKPDNVFLHTHHQQQSQRAVYAKIGDFGLSKSIHSPDDSVVDTRTISVDRDDVLHTTQLGTFTYASPEQLGYRWNTTSNNKVPDRVKRATYSIQSDIFALGVILLEICSPCTTMMERSQVLTGVRHGVIPQLTRQRFPEEMALVLKMTAMDPTERPNAKEIGQQIRKVLMRKSSLLTPIRRSKSSLTVLATTSAWNEIRELQAKLDIAVRQLREKRSHTTQQLELLVAELHDKVHSVGLTLA